MKKILKKTLKIAGITLLSLLALAFLIPILFKKQITNLVKKEINRSLTAKVDFTDVDLSLFRHFPKISIGLDGLNVVGTADFSSDTLLSAHRLDASVNLISAISGSNIKVYGVYLESPRIHAIVHKDGKANWDIAKPTSDTSTSTDTSSSTFKMHLKNYRISNGYIYYRDETSDMTAEIAGVDHEGSGDFTADQFTLQTQTDAETVDFTYAGIPYLNRTKTSIAAGIDIDNSTSKYSFKTDDISLNNLRLNADGFIQLANDSTYNMDIRFNTPSNDFKDILSLIPAIYKQDFEKIKTSGKAAFNGFVKGTYSPGTMPAYDVNLAVTDGFFQYPDLPNPVKNIQLALRASNIDGRPDNTVIDISKGHVEMANEPFDFKVLFKNPVTAQYVDAMAKGKLDLSNVSKFVKLDNGMKLAGLVWADIFARGNMIALQAQQGNFNAGGFLDIQRLFFSSNDFPQPIQNGNMKVELANSGGIPDNTTVAISNGHVEVGKDPVDFTLQLKKPMSSMDFSGTAKGSFTLDNVKQFAALDPNTSVSGQLHADLAFSGNKTAIDNGQYDKIGLNGSAGLTNMKYTAPDYPGGIAISTLQLAFTGKTVSLKELIGSYMKTNFTATGTINNLVGYALHDDPLNGRLEVSADKMNLNDWMGTDTAASTSTATTNSGPFVVPANLNLTLHAKAGTVTYDKVNYKNINGTLQLTDETVRLQDVKAEALDGSISFNGSYSTKLNKKDPAIYMSYDVKDVDIQQAFLSFNTVQKLMPIGQFLAGRLNSQLSLTGRLNGNMMPELSTLTGKGNLLLIDGVLKKFAPLEKIASVLQIDDLKAITLKDIKNYIEFANGKVLVKPFTVKVKDIEMEIGGMHGFDQTIDYAVQMKVPRRYLGNEGNQLLNNLSTQANAKGIPVNLGDVVNLNIKLAGSMSNPSIRTDLKEVAGDAVKEMQQQAIDFAKAKADTLRQTVKDTLNAVKNQVINDIKEEARNKIFRNKDSIKTNNVDSAKKKTEQTIKNTINNIFKKKKAAPDSTKH